MFGELPGERVGISDLKRKIENEIGLGLFDFERRDGLPGQVPQLFPYFLKSRNDGVGPDFSPDEDNAARPGEFGFAVSVVGECLGLAHVHEQPGRRRPARTWFRTARSNRSWLPAGGTAVPI